MHSKQNSPDQPAFIKKQYEFANYIRNPQRFPKPEEIEVRRMNIYHELFFNNVEDFMASTFPVIKAVLGERHWNELIRDYFEKHKAKTPFFNEMPHEFLCYLQTEREPHDADPAFLGELAHYEWAELAVSICDAVIPACNPDGDLLESFPLLTPSAWVVHYLYPVHLISESFQPEKPGETVTSIILYRSQDDEVSFLEINPVTARMLQLIEEKSMNSGREILRHIADEINHAAPDVVINSGLEILTDLRQRGIITGTQE